MQYILSEQELVELRTAQDVLTAGKVRDLEQVCMMAACYAPAHRSWAPQDRSPWGCIHCTRPTPGGVSNPTYCDECPARLVCQMPKRFSK